MQVIESLRDFKFRYRVQSMTMGPSNIVPNEKSHDHCGMDPAPNCQVEVLMVAVSPDTGQWRYLSTVTSWGCN